MKSRAMSALLASCKPHSALCHWWCGCTPLPSSHLGLPCHPTLPSHIFSVPLLSDISHAVPFCPNDKGVVNLVRLVTLGI